MKKQFKLGVIGAGFTATTILRGAVLSDFVHERKIIVSDKSEDSLDKLEYLGVHRTMDNKFAAENCEYLLIAVNEKNFDEVVKSFGGFCPEKVISVMPTVKKSVIKNSLGVGMVKVARAVVNLPSSIGSGCIGLDMTDYNKSPDDVEFISKIFNSLGQVVSTEENKLNALNALSGCGPAYCFMFLDALISAGVNVGLTENQAKLVAVQTLLGSAEMVQREEESLEDLLKQTCNINKASLECVKTFENQGFRKIINEAVSACNENLEKS